MVEVSQSGATVTVTGTLNHVPDWTEFSSNEADRTGYYVAFALNGAEGAYIGKTTKTGMWKTIPVADCEQSAGGLIVAVDKGQKSFTFQAFADEGDAQGKVNGTKYTVNLSGVTYGE